MPVIPSSATEPDESSFGEAFEMAERIPGWLTRDQAAVLWREARALAAGSRIVEIGTHQGRSAVVLALGAPEATLIAIDPFIDAQGFGGLATSAKLTANLAGCGVAGRVEVRQVKSRDLRPSWTGPIDLLYVDGKHDYWTLSDDLKWSDHVLAGSRVLVHDAFSSIGVTLGLLRLVVSSQPLRYLDRTGSLARFEVGPASTADRLRMLAGLPWWIRNVAIKVALRVARVFGNTTPDPY